MIVKKCKSKLVKIFVYNGTRQSLFRLDLCTSKRMLVNQKKNSKRSNRNKIFIGWIGVVQCKKDKMLRDLILIMKEENIVEDTDQ